MHLPADNVLNSYWVDDATTQQLKPFESLFVKQCNSVEYIYFPFAYIEMFTDGSV